MTGQFTLSGSSLTVTSALGTASPKVKFAANVELSSASQANYGGVYISSHMYLAPGAVYYGSGAGLTSLPAVLKAGDTMTGPLRIAGSSLTVVNTNAADPFSFAVTSDPSLSVYHLYVSTRGYVGIGTASPSSPLSVQGAVSAGSGVFAQTVTASSAVFTNVAGDSVQTSSGITAGGTVSAPFFAGNGSLLSGVLGTDSSRVSKAGDSMTGSLSVTGSSLAVVSGAGQFYAFTASSAAAMSAYSLSVTTGGNVGVQVAAPSAPLEVNRQIKISNAAASPASLYIYANAAPGYVRWADESLSVTTSQGALGFPAGGRDLVYRAAGSDPATGGQEVFRVKADSSGNWQYGIGTASPVGSLNINVATLFGPSVAGAIMYISTASSGVGIATTTITHKLTVVGDIMATSTISARGGYYGNQSGVLTLAAPTSYVSGVLGVGTQTPGARFGVSETGAETYTMVIGTNPTEGIDYDLVVTTAGKAEKGDIVTVTGATFPGRPAYA